MSSSKKLKITAVVLVAVLLISYVLYQVVTISKADIQTQIAISQTVYKTIDTKCFVVRDEKYIKNDVTGTTISFAKNGERVASGDTVSMIFNSANDADTYVKTEQIKKDIAHYEFLSGQANIQTLNVDSLDSKINTELTDYLDSVDKSEFSSAAEYSELFRNSVTSRQIATGEALDYSKELATLKNELETLNATKVSCTEVKSDRAGYYINGADGYENTVDYSKVDSLTAEDITSAINSKPGNVSASVIGRTVGEFKWYILTVVDSKDAVDLDNDEQLYVNIPYSGIEKLPVKVYKLGTKDTDKTILILSCDLMNDLLSDFRIEDIQIVTEQYSGYKLQNTAIRTVDGQTGVYVVRGNLIAFKKVHILYTTDKYTVVDNPDSESGYIKLYDEVVTKGVELYDNKLV